MCSIPLSLVLLPALLVACGQSNPSSTSTSAVPVTLTLPAPKNLRPQYVNPTHTTRLDVRIDQGNTTTYPLDASTCTASTCTVSLGLIAPGPHTFSVGSYGTTSASQPAVLISTVTARQTITAGQANILTLTLSPVNVTATLTSAVQQYSRGTNSFGNYVNFPTVGGRSLPAIYDVSVVDSLGDPIPGARSMLCGSDPDVFVLKLFDPVHTNRYRVEVRSQNPRTLSVHSGDSCALGSVLATQAVQGVRPSHPTLAAGFYHSLALGADGRVSAWGLNSAGELGDGTTTDRHAPVGVAGLANVIALTAGYAHSLALMSDGTVRAWGDNGIGQLGDGSTTPRPGPVLVSDLTNVVALAAGDDHSLALSADGTVHTWGFNSNGQLGDGSTTDHPAPVQVAGLANVVALAGGELYSLALRADGTLSAWGANDYGQLGDGSTTEHHAPVVVSGLTDVVAVAASDFHSLALTADGTVYAWGRNRYGELGDNSTTEHHAPVAVPGLVGVVALAGGFYHSLALSADGRVHAWGIGDLLGDGSTTDQHAPVLVSGVTNVVALAGGFYHSLALLSDGSVRAWGWNHYGELGVSSSGSEFEYSPVQVSGLPVVQLPTP